MNTLNEKNDLWKRKSELEIEIQMAKEELGALARANDILTKELEDYIHVHIDSEAMKVIEAISQRIGDNQKEIGHTSNKLAIKELQLKDLIQQVKSQANN